MAFKNKEEWQAARDAAVKRARSFAPQEMGNILGYDTDERGVQAYARDQVPDWLGSTSTGTTSTGGGPAVATGETETDNTAENIN